MYKEYQPCALLSPYIDKYWEFKGNPEYGMRINILPDGCTDFIFTLGEATQAVNSSLTMKPYRAYFIGPMNSYSELVAYAETVHMLGVRFLPCGLSRFIRLPLHELTNLRISADEVTCFFDTSFAERLCEEDSLENRIKIIEELFIKSLYKSLSLYGLSAILYNKDDQLFTQGGAPFYDDLPVGVLYCRSGGAEFQRRRRAAVHHPARHHLPDQRAGKGDRAAPV